MLFTKNFKQNILPKLLILPVMLSLTGCVYLVVGSLGALGGYVVSPDTVEGTTEHGQIEVWDAAYEVASLMGIIEEEHQDSGMLIARINRSKVTVSLLPVSDKTTKLSVKSRRSFFPNIRTSQEVYIKIMNSLNHSQ